MGLCPHVAVARARRRGDDRMSGKWSLGRAKRLPGEVRAERSRDSPLGASPSRGTHSLSPRRHAMVRLLTGAVLVVLMIASLTPASATAASVHPLFGLDNPSVGPFPSNWFTQPDDSQLTGLRVNLPKPDCSVRPSDCADIDVINTLDGFNLQPRVSIPFSDPIDLATVDSSTVFIVSLGDSGNGAGAGTKVGINQVVWDPVANTLHAEADALLDQHTRYALIATRDLRDLSGRPVEVSETFDRFRHDLNFGQTKDPDLKAYREMLLDALARAAVAGVPPPVVLEAVALPIRTPPLPLERIPIQIKQGNP